jgi:hypothetical protein
MTNLATNVQLWALVLCHKLGYTIQMLSYFVLSLKFNNFFMIFLVGRFK